MKLGLEGRVAIITGSGRGLGAAMAEMFSEEGARVVVTDIEEGPAVEVAGKLKAAGREAIAVRCDVTDAASVASLVERTLQAFGTVDILVNNAGGPRDRLIKDMTEADWHAVVEVILKGTFLCTRAVVPVMAERRHGRIINIASRAHHGNPGQANYSAAKAGLIGFTGSQAREQGRFNITVNCVAPGFVETAMVKALPHYEKLKTRTIANTPLPRLGRPDDIASAVVFLASDRASWITGETIHVTGGRFSN